jgi:single-strand DNA-binding protein
VVPNLAARWRRSGSPSATGAGAAELRRTAMFYNEAQVCLTGYVATQPDFRTVGDGIPLLSMRVAWTNRRRDAVTGEWADGNTSFVNVNCWRKLAENLSTCLRKGDPVLLRGRLDVRPFVGKDGQRRISVDVDAQTLGHDLTRGVAGFRRAWSSAGKTAEQHAAGQADGEPGEGLEHSDDEAAALAALTDGGSTSGAGGPAGEDIFDDSAIEALAQETGSVTAPF